MKRGSSAKLAALFLVIAGTALYGSLSSASTTKPAESGFKVSPNVVGGGGGSVLLSAKVTNATTCIFLVSPAVSGFAYNHVCSSGTVSYKAILPKNTSTSKKVYSFRIEVKGKAGQATVVSPVVTATVNTSATSGGGGSTGPAKTIATIPVAAEPDALLQVGNDVWVASCSGNAVTEINSSNYAVINTLSSPSYQFDCPDALAFDGTNLWVANRDGNSLMEFNLLSSSLVNTISSSAIAGPLALTFDGTNIWVLNGGNYTNTDGVSKINATSGVLVKQFLSSLNGIYIPDPSCISYTGSYIWVNEGGGSQIVQFSLNDIPIRTQSINPSTVSMSCVAYHAGYVWASSYDNAQVIEYNADTGAYVRLINGVTNPYQLAFSGSDIFVVTTSSPFDTVREYSLTGSFIQTVATSNKNLDNGIRSILVDGSNLWVADYSSNTVTVHSF